MVLAVNRLEAMAQLTRGRVAPKRPFNEAQLERSQSRMLTNPDLPTEPHLGRALSLGYAWIEREGCPIRGGSLQE